MFMSLNLKKKMFILVVIKEYSLDLNLFIVIFFLIWKIYYKIFLMYYMLNIKIEL